MHQESRKKLGSMQLEPLKSPLIEDGITGEEGSCHLCEAAPCHP